MQKIQNPELWDKIQKLDLRAIIHKLTHVEEKYGWPVPVAEAVEKAYKRYLYLAGTYGGTVSIVPTKIIDEFWHMHILDTRKYAEDCGNLFGRLLHHYPYLGIRYEGDRENLNNAFVNTQSLWKEIFEEEMMDILTLQNNSAETPSECEVAPSCESEPSGKPANKLKNLLAEAQGCDTCGADSCAVSNCGSNQCNGYISEKVPEYLMN
jgi:hypothetical protein